jgi:hypothetical protein
LLLFPLGKTLDIPYDIFNLTSGTYQPTIGQIKTVPENGASLSYRLFCDSIAGPQQL